MRLRMESWSAPRRDKARRRGCCSPLICWNRLLCGRRAVLCRRAVSPRILVTRQALGILALRNVRNSRVRFHSTIKYPPSNWIRIPSMIPRICSLKLLCYRHSRHQQLAQAPLRTTDLTSIINNKHRNQSQQSYRLLSDILRISIKNKRKKRRHRRSKRLRTTARHPRTEIILIS